jgi:hypothetical protein
MKVGDIVIVKSLAGDSIPHIHVRLVERVIVKPRSGKQVGFRKTMDWPGYSGWHAEIVFQEEADYLRKTWSIPFEGPGDKTFAYDHCIVKKPRNPKPLYSMQDNKPRKRRRIVRKKPTK